MNRFLALFINIFSKFSFLLYSIIFIYIFFYLLKNSWFPFTLESVFGDASPIDAILLKEAVFDGLFPAITGTFLLVITAVCLAVPVGVGTGIWISEYAKGKVYLTASLFLDILSGIPSIVVGLFGFSFILIFHKFFPGTGPFFSIFISACALGFLVIPYIARSTENGLNSIDRRLRLAGLSLGASKIENIRYVLVPKAFSSILSGILLSIARCAEDTAVIMLTGAVASAGVPGSLFERFEALPFFIYYTSSEYSSGAELKRAFDASIMLILISVLLFVFSFILKKRFLGKSNGKN